MATHFFKPALEACVKTFTQGFPRYVDKLYMPLVEALVTAIVLTVILVIRHRLRGARPEAEVSSTDDEPSVPQVPRADAAPAFKSQLISGAIADRFKIPGLETRQAAAPQSAAEPASQATHVKTKLKLHASQESSTPSVSLKPIVPDAD